MHSDTHTCTHSDTRTLACTRTLTNSGILLLDIGTHTQDSETRGKLARDHLAKPQTCVTQMEGLHDGSGTPHVQAGSTWSSLPRLLL